MQIFLQFRSKLTRYQLFSSRRAGGRLVRMSAFGAEIVCGQNRIYEFYS